MKARARVMFIFVSAFLIGCLLGNSNLVSSVNAQGMVPLAGAAVVATGPDGSGSAVTDTLGRYQISDGLVTSNYSLIVSLGGYLDAQIDQVPVVAGKEVTGLNFFLKRSGVISGKVTGPTGSPLKGIVVNAIQTKGTGGNSSSYATTGADGLYNIHTGLSTGTYNVIAGFVFEQFDQEFLKSIIRTINTDFQVTRIDRQAETIDALVKGVFRNEYDSGVRANVTATIDLIVPHWIPSAQWWDRTQVHVEKSVEAYFPSHENVTVTIDTGPMKVEIDELVDPSAAWAINYYYSIQISSAKGDNLPSLKPDIAVNAGHETSNINFQISIPPSASISGRVTDTSGNAINAAMVYASGSGYWTTKSDADGYYLISEGLGTGDYYVCASAPGYKTSSMGHVNAKVSQATNGIDFHLQKISGVNSGKISGQTTGESNPISEFSAIAVPVVFSFASLIIMFASIKIKYNKSKSWLRA